MDFIESLWGKFWDNIIYAPLIAFFFKPVKTKVEVFFRNILPWYKETYYKKASLRETHRSSIFSLFILAFLVLGCSEVVILEIFNPSLPLVDDVIYHHPNETNYFMLAFFLIINLGVFITCLRLESMYIIVKKFEQMISIIRPELSDLQYYILLQKWALMKTEDDYKAIIIGLISEYPILNDKDKFKYEIGIFEASLKNAGS